MKVLGLYCTECEKEWLSDVADGDTCIQAATKLGVVTCPNCGTTAPHIRVLDLPGTRNLIEEEKHSAEADAAHAEKIADDLEDKIP